MLRADQNELSRFIDILFRYADEGTFISLRAFEQFDRGRPALFIEAAEINGVSIAPQAWKAAQRAANAPRPAVFAPPVATFNNPNTARSEDVANGIALSVEIDAGDPERARRRLEHLLGPVSVAVHSGGEWADPETGELHPKTHLHWRLSEPTRTPEDHAKLRDARWLAAVLVGADTTAAPPAHPLRWPGSLNLKSTPRLARIAVGNEASEIHLEDALEKLQEAVEAAGVAAASGPKISANPQAALSVVRSAISHIPNPDLHWEEWNRIGMAVWRATGGSPDGLTAWADWSAQSRKHDEAACAARWNHFATSPPNRIGAGTLFFFAAQNGWTRTDSDPPETPTDPGYFASLEADAGMSAAEWERIEQRESGHSAPSSEEAQSKAKDAIWTITEPWDEAAIPNRPWIARGYLMRGAVTVVSGPGSAGKSSLMVGWATALTVGSSFHRLKPAASLRVAVYNVEDDQHEQKRRFSAMLRRLKLTPQSWEDRLAILGPTTVGTLLHLARDGSLLVNTPVMDRLEEFIVAFRPDVLILDPFVELHGAEENDNTMIRAVMAKFRALAGQYNMAVVLLHHARKGFGSPGDPDTMRGASSIVGAARVALTCNVMSQDEAKSFNLNEDKRRDYFRLDGAKNNYARLEEAEWFERQEIELANGDGVAVAWPWRPPSPFKDTTPQGINGALDKIARGPEPGFLYAASRRGRSAGSRWAGNLLIEELGVNDRQAQSMVDAWLKSGLLREIEYRSPTDRKPAKGLSVDDAKRPS